MNLSEEIKKCYSLSDFCRIMGLSTGGGGLKKIKSIIKENGLDIRHFDRNHSKRKYPLIDKICPVCNTVFKARLWGKKEKTTCSYSCSNTFFRSGKNNGNWNDDSYRSTCFLYHKKECVVCKESNIVEVHHLDENRNNNNPENLIPLCPTHHQYWHSRYKEQIEVVISKYISERNKCYLLKTSTHLLSDVN